MNFGSHVVIENYKKKFDQMVKSAIHKYADLISCENVVGDNLESVSNCYYCFDLKEVKDCKYIAH